MSRYTLTEPAQDDIRDIVDFYGDRSRAMQRRIITGIRRKCHYLGGSPRSSSRPRPDLAVDLHSSAVEDHIIYFRIAKRGIEVIRVIHGARDVTPDDFEDLD
jgi:toxin ParE1/3/4